jgi:hypothetical protein
MRILKSAVSLLVMAAIPFVLLGCPDKANPDPATAAKDAGAAAHAATAPAAGGSAAAPAKNGGGW